jgi:hypothetical protein
MNILDNINLNILLNDCASKMPGEAFVSIETLLYGVTGIWFLSKVTVRAILVLF